MSITTVTHTGLASIPIWNAAVGLVRTATHGIGPMGGVALLYSISFFILLAATGVVLAPGGNTDFGVGNMMANIVGNPLDYFLIALSSLIPILTSVLTSIAVGTQLSPVFWQGRIPTPTGLLLCRVSTRGTIRDKTGATG